jgi:hypothetical protein
MKEDFVQYIWKFRLFNSLNLQTHSGKKVEIIQQGLQNFSSGPDFTNAKLKIDGQLWAGNVEIHLNVNDWNLHHHSNDEAYNNVILHVVYNPSEKQIETQNGRVLETVFLRDLVFPETEKKYNLLMSSNQMFVPCENFLTIKEVSTIALYDSLVTERLERKINDIERDIELCFGDLDKAFLISLFKYFGAPKNKTQFEILAKNIELKHLIKQAVSVESLEALLFGVAGLLDTEIACDYKHKLENEFAYQKNLYKIESPLKYSQWKFSAVRPPNFPTIRIAQLAAVCFVEQRWFSYIQNEEDVKLIRNKLKCNASAYWNTHYNFNIESKKIVKSLSEPFLDKIMINVIVPFLFYYGKFVQDERYLDRAFDILLSLKPEKNKITEAWHNIGFSNSNAFEYQALIGLKQNYCDKKRCLECKVGYKILKNE